MKKRFTILLISAVTICLAFPFKLSADPGDDPTPVIIIEIGDPDENPHRGSVQIPIECYYYSSLSSVVACFQYSLGTVNVEIQDLDSGSVSSQNVNGTTGIHVIPVSSSPGSYSITFTLSDGTEYVGAYTIE